MNDFVGSLLFFITLFCLLFIVVLLVTPVVLAVMPKLVFWFKSSLWMIKRHYNVNTLFGMEIVRIADRRKGDDGLFRPTIERRHVMET